MRYLAAYDAQRRVDPKEYKALSAWQSDLWLAILTACQTPGLPIDDALMQAQLAAIWTKTSTTYHRLTQ